jgi:hypothetical protein
MTDYRNSDLNKIISDNIDRTSIGRLARFIHRRDQINYSLSTRMNTLFSGATCIGRCELRSLVDMQFYIQVYYGPLQHACINRYNL